MIRRLAACALLFAIAIATRAGADDVVLVVGRDSTVENLSMLQVRKAYMAVSVIYDGKPIRAQRLDGDARSTSHSTIRLTRTGHAVFCGRL